MKPFVTSIDGCSHEISSVSSLDLLNVSSIAFCDTKIKLALS